MTAFFTYPKSAAFGRVLPKNKIYEHTGASTALKALFVAQVDQIAWKYKLAPETINLTASKAVPEIQVFWITLKTGELSNDVLRSIDKAIPFPLLFELHYGGKRKAVATYKRPSEADSTKWVISDYFGSAWVPEDAPRAALPVTLNLAGLYEKLLAPLMPDAGAEDEPIEVRVERMELILAKERELAKVKARLAKEKQFNKRVAINAELRDIKKELKALACARAQG